MTEIALLYVLSALSVGAVTVELDHHRGVNDAPLVYLLMAIIWPLVGITLLVFLLTGQHTSRVDK